MAFPIDISVDSLPAPGYFIYRDSPLGQYDPTAPPVFYPAKDSDELFDALRIKFPLVKTHSERMRDAIIEFLMEERQAEALSAPSNETSPNMSLDQLETSPWQQSWPSMSSGSASASPEMADFATSFGDSPRSQNRQSSTAATQPSTPQLEDMTGVFSLTTSEQPKQRLRRKMTEAEKVEYRKRRIVKACEKCAKRKRKCQHNQPEMESMNSKATSKVVKPRTSPSTKSISTATPKTEDLHTPINFDSFTGDQSFEDIQLFDDFTTFFDEPLLDFGLPEEKVPFDSFISTDAYANSRPHNLGQTAHQPQVSHWPWTDTQDFTLLDFNSADHQFAQSSSPHNHPPGSSSESSTDVLPTSAGRQLQDNQGIPGGQQHRPIEIPQPTHTSHVHDGESSGSFVGDSPGDSAGILALQASKPLSRGSQGLAGLSRSVRSSGHQPSSQPSSALQSASLDRAGSDISLAAPDLPVVAHTRAQVPGQYGEEKQGVAPSRFKNGSLAKEKETHEPVVWHGRSSSASGDGVSENVRAGGVIGAVQGDWASSSVPGIRVSERTPASLLQGATGVSQASTSVPGTSKSLSSQGGVLGAQQGRQSGHLHGVPGPDLTGQDVNAGPAFARSTSSHGVSATGVSSQGVSAHGTIAQGESASSGSASSIIAKSDAQTVNSASELYMLKKRMSTNPGKSQNRSATGLSPLGGSTGLLPILPVSSSATPVLQTIPARVKEESGSPVLASAAVSQRNGDANVSLAANNCAPLSSAVVRAGAVLQTNCVSAEVQSSNAGADQEDRPMDHVRYRDHHGRQSMGLGELVLGQVGLPKLLATSAAASPALFLLVAACLFTTLFQAFDPYMVAIALIVPFATESSLDSRSSDHLTIGKQQKIVRAEISSKNLKLEDWLS